MKLIFKNFNNHIKKTVAKLNDKTNSFYKKIKVVKYFNNFIQKILNQINNQLKKISKIKYKKDSQVSNFNKFIITLISILFFYLFYLLVPTFYDKAWIQNTLEKKMLDEFNINYSTSSDITYNILPAPHFLIKNSKIFIGDNENQKVFSEIKNFKIFIFQNNFFNKTKVDIKKILIDKANFSLQSKDLNFLSEAANYKFSKKKIKIKRSTIFFRDNNKETIAIIKVPKAILFYDDLNLINLFNLDGKVFNIPFSLSLENNIEYFKKKKININSKKLKLKITDETLKKIEDTMYGLNTFSIMNSKLETSYNIKNKIVSFMLNNSKLKNSNINYNGKISINPFDLSLNIDLKKYKLSKLFNADSLIIEFLKTKLLFNDNISAMISVNIDSNKNNEVFKSSIIKFNIGNGKINFDNTKLFNKRIGILELTDSNLFYKDDMLIFNANALIDIQNNVNLFSLFQTPKNFRKSIKTFLINFDYDLLASQVIINDFKIDGKESNNEMLSIITKFNNSVDYNLNKSKRVFNRLLSAYDG
jgi:hypothetical protein